MGWEVHFQLSRHDHHNVEFKLHLETGGEGLEGKLDLYLFFPGAAKLSAHSKQEIISDFHPRFRLSIPKDEAGPSRLSRAAEEFANALQGLHSLMGDSSHQSFPEEYLPHLLHLLRQTGASVGEGIKRQKSRHKRLLLLIQKGHSDDFDPRSILRGIEQTSSSIESLQRLLQDPEVITLPYVSLLRDYTRHLYIQYLGSLDTQIREWTRKQPSTEHQAFREEMSRVLDEMLASSWLLASNAHERELFQNDRGREDLLLKISQLKKFFQSNMFVDVSTRQVMARFTEPAAAVAAGFAAFFAAMFQQFSQPDLMRFGLGGVSFLSLGVAVYILKDRLKDKSKAYLTQKAAAYLPDVEHQLIANQEPIGTTKEWFTRAYCTDLDAAVRELRNRNRLSDAELHLPEEVVHYENQFWIPNFSKRTRERYGAIKKSLRINFERHLKYLDDPFKWMTLLDPAGRLARVEAHRVYHFYLVAELRTFAAKTKPRKWTRVTEKGTPAYRVFRIVMDKAGIQRVDRLSEIPADISPSLSTIPLGIAPQLV